MTTFCQGLLSRPAATPKGPGFEVAFDLVKSHFHDASNQKEPLCLIINGVAGTGKSYLINAIKNLLKSKCAITATTGKAAYNIKRGNSTLLIKVTYRLKRQ